MRIQRRKFVYLAVAGVALYALDKILFPLKYVFTRSNGRFQARETKKNAFVRNGKSLVGVVKGDNVGEMVRASVDLIGGIDRLGLEGKEVLVKPNVNSDDPYPATTNPEVIRSVIELLYEAGAEKVKVADMSNQYYLPTVKTMEKLGIKKAAEDAGAEVTSFDDDEWTIVKDPRMKYSESFMIPRTVYEAEKLVSVPVLKTHEIATYSMSLKNFVGILHPRDRSRMHLSKNLEEMVAEISLAVHPDLIVMDATRSMVAGGPFEGTVKDTNMVLASGDRIAIDIVGLAIVKSFGEWERVSGIGVWEQRQIKRAIELDLGSTSKDEIELFSKSLKDDANFSHLIDSIKYVISS